MPRPGPRPYECVRRAWHSDIHQPIRGSLIQEIFRVVNEIHSPATKKNKEWQEKLPVVVLKAEEIMYSKANSEAEYMDLKTLLDRTNDAINTIIRLDESTETGHFLKPCIEAALHLGCTPRRASRSQRNINPRYYLDPNSQELNNSDNTSQNQLFPKPLAIPSRNPSSPIPPNYNFAGNKFPFMLDNNDPFAKCLASKYSIYPLYQSFRLPPKPNSNSILSPFASNANSKKKPAPQTSFEDKHDDVNNCGCDLSLRLGPFENIGPNTRKRAKPSASKPAFCSSSLNDPLISFSSLWVSNDGIKNSDARKSKKVETFGQTMVDRKFSWQPKLSYGQL